MLIVSRISRESVGVGGADGLEGKIIVTVKARTGQEQVNPQTPAEPTDALPGSPGKIAVLARRFAARLQLWHPLDACTGMRRCAGRRRQMWGNLVQVF